MTIIPVIKVGAVLVRRDGAVLIVQPKPKRVGEAPPFVLPRGSRQYHVHAGDHEVWQDARDIETAIAHIDTLEPFSRALAREVEEEAGLPAEQLRRLAVVTMGPRDFTSRRNSTYAIYWFVVPVDADALAAMNPSPEDALMVRWATYSEIQAMAAAGEFSPGYAPVIAEALTLQAVQTSP